MQGNIGITEAFTTDILKMAGNEMANSFPSNKRIAFSWSSLQGKKRSESYLLTFWKFFPLPLTSISTSIHWCPGTFGNLQLKKCHTFPKLSHMKIGALVLCAYNIRFSYNKLRTASPIVSLGGSCPSLYYLDVMHRNGLLETNSSFLLKLLEQSTSTINDRYVNM